MEWISAFQTIFRNLTKVAGPNIVWGNGLCPLYWYVLNEYVKWLSLEETVISVMSYLCFCRKLDVVQILPAKTACNNRSIEAHHEKLQTADEGKLQLWGCGSRLWTEHDQPNPWWKSITSCWSDGVSDFNNIGNAGLTGWIMTRRRWKSPVRHHSFFPSLTTGPIVLLNGETVGITTPSLKASYIWVSVLGPILIYIGQYELFYSWSREESQGSPIFPSQF